MSSQWVWVYPSVPDGNYHGTILVYVELDAPLCQLARFGQKEGGEQGLDCSPPVVLVYTSLCSQYPRMAPRYSHPVLIPWWHYLPQWLVPDDYKPC